MNSNVSIYIPRMSAGWTHEAIRDTMAYHHIGTVSYVDFTPINKKPGFGENVDDVVMSAFVHFIDPIMKPDNQYNSMRNFTETKQFWDRIASGQAYKLRISSHEYWLCLKNKNPIQRTMMNIHQIVENGRHLENLITQQAVEIKNLKDIVDSQQKSIDGHQSVIYQLLGGLFCQRTQSGILYSHLRNIGLDTSYNHQEADYIEHPSGIWPTTRQGDECEKKIERLEKIIENLLIEEKQDNELWIQKHFRRFNNNDESSIDSDLLEDGEIPSETSERIKNSYQLCGNN